MKTYFVSSTFRDMQFERDALHTTVSPYINGIGADYGERIDFCDLRWGIDTSDMDSEEGNAKVLDVCLNEIDRCRPCMIVLLGERYGWIPKKEQMESAVKGFGSDIYATIEAELEMSVTQLEIEYGVLSTENRKDAFFFFREVEGNVPKEYQAESRQHAAYLKKLKKRIEEITNCNIHTYKTRWNEETQQLEGMDDFAKLVCETLLPSLESEWKSLSSLSPRERDRKIHTDYAFNKAALFCGRKALADEVISDLFKNKMLALCGNSGVGKSTLMAHLSFCVKENGFVPFPVFCGLTSYSDTINGIIREMIFHLETLCGLPNVEISPQSKTYNQEIVEYLQKLIYRCTEDAPAPTVFLIDALDQLGDIDSFELNNFLSVEYTDKVMLLFSHLPSLRCDAVNSLKIDVLSYEEEREILLGMLKASNREIGSAVIEKILEKTASVLPLYSNLLIQRLSLIDRKDFERIYATGGSGNEIMQYQKEMIDRSADSVEDLCTELIREVSARIGGNFVEEALRYLAVSRYGLRQTDIEQLLISDNVHYNSLDFAHFLHFLQNFFIKRSDGCIDFAHQSIRKGILSSIDRKKYDSAILYYLKNLSKADPVRRANIIYHCLNAQDKKAFIELYEEDESYAVDYRNCAGIFKNLKTNEEVQTAFLYLFYRYRYEFLHSNRLDCESFLKEGEMLAEEYLKNNRIDNTSYHLINAAFYNKHYNFCRIINGADVGETKALLDRAVSEICQLTDDDFYQCDEEFQKLLASIENARGVLLMESEIKELTEDPMLYFGKSFDIYARYNQRDGIKNEMVNAMLWLKKQAGFYRQNHINRNAKGWNVPSDTYDDKKYTSLLSQAIEWLYSAYDYRINDIPVTCSYEELCKHIEKTARFRSLSEMSFENDEETRRQYYEYCYQIYFENTNHPGKDNAFWESNADLADECVRKAETLAKEDGEITEIIRLNRYKASVVKRRGELSSDRQVREKYLKEAIRILEKNDITEGHRSRLLRLRELANAYLSLNDFKSAAAVIRSVEEILYKSEKKPDWIHVLKDRLSKGR